MQEVQRPSFLYALTCWTRVLGGVLCAFGLLSAVAPIQAQSLPSLAQVQAQYRASETHFLSREGQWLQRLRTRHDVRQGEWVALEAMSPALRHALVLSEDRRFYAHSGVDWKAVSAAAWGNLWNTRTRGASTLTMQLAGLLHEELLRGPQGRTVWQKVHQAWAAQRLEQQWRKSDILEAYLNLVPFRGELVGIDALSRTLFGKAPHGLDWREAAVAVALVRGPNAASAAVAQRACGVWRELQAQPQADCSGLAFWVEGVLKRRAWRTAEGIAPHFARQWLRRQPAEPEGPEGANILHTTLSAPVQRLADQLLRQHLQELQTRQVEDGAVVVLDNATGEVLAWVGSSGSELSRAAEVDGVLALRQPGSTLKPFLYAQALGLRRLTAASLIDDSPAHLSTAAGLYVPQNYDRSYKGWVSVRTALASSLNIPAVRTLSMVGVEAFFEQLQQLGLSLRENGGYHGYSLALGSSEVSLLALTNAYRALANGGQWQPVAWPHAEPVPAQPVLDARAAFIVGDILADPNARSRTFGTDSVLATRMWTAVKTGTSKDLRDNWVVGWSSRYTVGVWVGNASGAPMQAVSGTDGAAPIWAQLMAHLHAGHASPAPVAPAGLQAVRVQFGPASSGEALPLEAERNEWFLEGTQQTRVALNRPRAAGLSEAVLPGTPRIREPAEGTILALDPDIPPAYQRLQLVADRADSGLSWYLDGKSLGRGPRVAWFPLPGRHRLELRGPQGVVWDAVQIEVRGAGWASGKRF